MKNIYKFSAFLFAVLMVSALAANAQSTTTAKQETAQAVPAEAYFNVESLDNLKNATEEAYIKYQNAAPDHAEVLAAEFRKARRSYIAELEKQAANYAVTTETGAKIRAELNKTSKDLR